MSFLYSSAVSLLSMCGSLNDCWRKKARVLFLSTLSVHRVSPVCDETSLALRVIWAFNVLYLVLNPPQRLEECA